MCHKIYCRMGKYFHHLVILSFLLCDVFWSSAQSSTPLPSDSSPTPTVGGSGGDNVTVAPARQCIMDVQTTVTDDLRNLLKEESAVFVYFKLEIDGTPRSSLYDNSSDVVDPFTLVWALEGKGQLYLTYPFDFVQLSLGTLSQGVVEFDVPVALPNDGCFQAADDDGKQRILAKFVSGLIESVKITSLNMSDVYADKGAVTCIEKQLGPKQFDIIGVYAIPLCTYYVFQGSTVYECWRGDQDPFDSTPQTFGKHGWLGGIFAFGFILALFSPLAASFFIRRHPPIEIHGKPYLALNSDLPLGLKYLLCFSLQEFKAIVAVRWFVYVIAFMFIPFIPYIVSYITQGEVFTYRTEVAYGLLLSRGLVIFWYFFVNLIFLAIAMLFLGLYLYDEMFVPNSLVVLPADRRYFGFVFDMPSDIRVPANKDPGTPPLRGFMDTMWYRTQMAINPDIWRFFFHDTIWVKIYGLLGCRGEGKHWCQFFFTAIIFIFLFPFASVIFIFLLLLNSVPLIYTLTWTIAKSLSNDVKPSEVIVALMTMFLSFAVLFIFVASFVYIAELLAYTFIGFIINSDFSGPVLVVILVVAGYLISAATDFYDKYCVLLKNLIEKAQHFDEAMAKEGREVIQPSSPAGHAGVHLQSQGPSQSLLPPVTRLVEYQKGVPTIPMKLFKLVVAKYLPMYLEVASILLQLLLIGILVAFGLSTIIYIKAVTDLPASVEFFATVVVAGVVPLLTLILKSPAKEENDLEAKGSQLEADLEYYANCEPGNEHFESMTF